MKPKRFDSTYLTAAAAFLALALLWAMPALADEGKPLAKAVQERTAAAEMQEKWGIEVVALHTAAAGNMVDFRYKVLDSQKAEALFSKKTKPYLIHQESGQVLAVPRTAKVGPLMSSYRPKEDRIYWMFFGNQAKLVKPGDTVTVVIGDFKAENLKVE
jgi:hypothetical protein